MATPSVTQSQTVPLVTPSPKELNRELEEQLADLRNATDCGGPLEEIPAPPKFTKKHKSDGQVLYKANCIDCHGMPGQGPQDFSKYPTLDPPPIDLAGFQTYKYGTEAKALYRTIHYGIEGTGMAPLGDQLSPEEIWSVIAYLDSFR